MASDRETNLITAVTSWRPSRRRILLRRRKLPTVRLGGKRSRRRLFIVRILSRMRLRWLKLQYSCMLRKIKEYYLKLMKDISETGASFDGFQQRLLMEISFTVPVMGVSFASIPSMAGSSERPRPSIMF